ncbi:disco-interacting protein 2 isoform X1 [Metopolophium dirhodum]|uniref:disco-interacting protein 2 isoform X1 n=1 Tax=Metopolophium dirhodum TaxID=44670 RepID=UPI00298FAA12|nr:disco-interacting protein 2 isoform X1 [Metopolophium dirhodum]
MKPITFENLRRLIGGRRKNKDRNESPFKRSDSFKRISIRRNYLDGRGGGQKGRNPTKKPPPIDGDDSPQQQHSSVLTSAKPDGSLPTSPPVVSRLLASPRAASRRPLSPLPAPPCRDHVPPPPVERRRQAVAPAPPPPPPPSPPPTGSTTAVTTTTTGSSAPAPAASVIDYGEWIRCIRAEEDLNNLKRSCSPPPPPTPPARYRYHVHKELDDSSRTDSAISLGRIWMDAPMLPPAAPRSLELPARPAAAAAMAADGDGQPQRRAHHSLESALKDKRDDRPVPCRRFHRYPVAGDGVNKTASRSSVASTCSGKDSGFSLSAPGLSDPPRPSKQQLFRKKAPRRPAVGVAAKPTTAALHPPPTPQDQLYQVVVARSPFRQLKLDPMMFVPPEKRRPTQHHHHHHHHTKPRPVVEIRDYCVPKDARLQRRDPADDYRGDTDDYDDEDDEQDRLYESISKGSRGRWQESTDDADTEDDEQEQLQQLYHRRHQQHHHYQHQNHDQHRTPAAAARNTNRVKRKKSARRNIKYVVKPVRRAPSAATRRPSVTAKSKSAGTPISDITQKGYEKKKTRLLAPYAPKQPQAGPPSASNSKQPSSQQHQHHQHRTRRTQRRVTHNEKRYHSEVRQEAVQQALAAMQSRPKPSLPMPSKRTSVMAKSPDRSATTRNETDSSSDDDSVGDHIPDRGEAKDRGSGGRERSSGADTSSTGGSARDTPPHPKTVAAASTTVAATTITPSTTHGPQHQPPPSMQQHRHHHHHHHTKIPNGAPGGGVSGNNGPGYWDESRTIIETPKEQDKIKRNKPEVTEVADMLHNVRPPYPQPPDVTNNVTQSRRYTPADRVNRYSRDSRQSSSDDGMGTVSSSGRWKVSAKIQQLLNTLKRPKRRPLPEFYEDDDVELEIAANPKDPNAPRPEGAYMSPALGEPLSVPSGLPRNLEAALQRYGSSTFKAPVATVLDPNGKLSITLTYGKLLSRSHKVAYTLLNRPLVKGNGGGECLKHGDRVALVYPNSDPLNFLCSFYGCIFAGIVPVPIEVPLTRRDAGSQQIGFLLGSCGVQVALTSDVCLKGLPKTATGDVVAFKGWPKLHWFVTEHLPKTPKDWCPPPHIGEDTPSYIEYTTDKEGSVMGVSVSRTAMLNQCRALSQSCNYTEGDTMVCVLDFKRETGLWHSVLTSILNGMHVIYIPYALMKVNPASWMQMITKYRASVAVVKSRDLHWGLLATKDHKDIVLSSLRLLLVGDGANPWSLSSCDQFLAVFQSKGLRPDALCPCASSSECLTVSVRRPGRAGVNATGRGVLSMSGLSYGVVRVDQENSLTSLTLQDCGQVMPNCSMVVVKMDGIPYMCKTDEVGEICMGGLSTTTCNYWGLPGLSNATFRVAPIGEDGKPTNDTIEYTRSGLLGFLGPGGLVFVCGSRDGLMTVTGRKHNADDIIATVLAVEPMKFIYRGRIAVFAIRVLRDERICVIAEQRPECSEEESFQWMSRVLQAVDSIHQVGLYCLALVPPNYLPKTPLGGIHLSECKRRFLDGNLHPANVLMCPHTCVTNLPKPREAHSVGGTVSDVGPASVMVGTIVQGNRLATAQGRDIGIIDMESDSNKTYLFISEILKMRAIRDPDHVIFTLVNAKGGAAATLTCSQLHKRAEKVSNLLNERAKVNTGDHVALIFPPGIDLICAFYGCLYVGAVPVTIRPPHPQNLQTTLPTVRMIVDVSKSTLVLSNQNIIKLLKSKEASNVVDVKSWPVILDTDDMPKKKIVPSYRAPTAELLAYLDFSVSTTGMLAGIKMSHAAVTSLCRSMKLACELYPSRHIALCLDPYCGLGFALWCLSSVYSGHHSILIPPSEIEINPGLWLTAVSQYQVRDTFCSYGVMELCTKGLASSVGLLKQRGVNLACVRTCVVVAEERPRINLTTSFSKLFSALGLSPRAVSTSFGCRVNVAICLQGASSPEPSCVYVDLRALRNDRVSLVERGSPHSLCLLESGKLLPGVKVIIAHPDTKGHCGDSHLGEIWVQAPHNASGYFSVFGNEIADGGNGSEQFNARLVTGSTGEIYARTGYLGFLRRTESTSTPSSVALHSTDTIDIMSLSDLSLASSNQSTLSSNTTATAELPELHDAVFVVGALDETIILRGMRYHPIDIENSVMRCHRKIAECAVFAWTNLLVVVVELDGNESEALDLVPLVTNVVLEEHHLIVGVAVVVDPGVVPINSRGEKQRMHLRDGFLADQLDPIYVAYNM